ETAVHTQHEVGMPPVRPIKSSPAHRNNQMPTNQPNTISEPADMNANSSLLLTTPDLANSSAHQVAIYDSSIEEEIEIEIEDPIQNEPDQTPSNEMTNERMINMIETWV
uniref:Deformed n=1 Tax=Acrobeloides nanus TaxID=290746 RepID=A0A914CGE5_9BILA